MAIFFSKLRIINSVNITKKKTAPYTVYLITHSDVRLVFLRSLHRIKDVNGTIKGGLTISLS